MKTQAFTRRDVLKALSAGAAVTTLSACASLQGKPTVGRVIVVGAGYGGLTAAKYLRLWSEGAIEVTLVDPNESFISFCGRVCPQEDQCEKFCIVGKKDDPVAIGRLERFAADWERNKGEVTIPEKTPSTGRKVAVVGAGPGGLTLAGDLILKGHEVTIFEALHKTGGVLIYGIPEFRLPKDIVQAEVNYLERLGVKVECNCVIGRIETVDELLQEYDAVSSVWGQGFHNS